MNNEIIISHISMPYGVLHDQKLNIIITVSNLLPFFRLFVTPISVLIIQSLC